MEGIFAFIGFLALFAIPILWSRISALRKRADEAEGNHRSAMDRIAQLELKSAEISRLTERVKAVEAEVRSRPAAAPPEAHVPAAPTTPPPVRAPESVAPPPAVPHPAAPKPAAQHAPSEIPLAAKPVIPAPVTPVPPPHAIPPPTAVPAAAKVPAAPAASPQEAAPPPRAATPGPAPHAAGSPPRITPRPAPSKGSEKVFDIEQALGTNWLSKLGVIILVFGLVFWLGTQLPKLSPLGKVMVGYAVGGALLGAGIFLEKRMRFALLGRTAAGGGWALLYFTTYAMHHVAAARVIDSQAVDLTLLLVVAAAMVAHTLTYDSQTATSIAFLLAFATVTVSRDSVYSLSASAVLAAALVVIVLWRRWYQLEVFGLLASYLNHYLWLRGIIEPMAGHHRPFPEFTASTMLLFFYWAVFRVSYVLRRQPAREEEQVSTVAGLLNIGLLLGLLRYQSVHPELAFWALLGLGAAELSIGQLPLLRVRRRAAFLALTTFGASLLIAAFPFRYSGSNLSMLWLVEGEALFLMGMLSREAVFRYFGLLAAALTAGHMLAVDAWHVLEARTGSPHSGAPEYAVALLFAVAAAVFYADSHFVCRRWKEILDSGLEELYPPVLSCFGGVLAFTGMWLAFPAHKTPVGWAALVLLLVIAGFLLHDTALTVQADVGVLAAFIWIWANNWDATKLFHGLTVRLISVAAVSALVYAAAYWRSRTEMEFASAFSAGYTTAGTVLLAVLAYKELPNHWVAVAWAAFALVLLLAARFSGRRELPWQAHGLTVAAVYGAALWDFTAAGSWHGLTLRLITVSAVAVLVYLSTPWISRESSPAAGYIRDVYPWFASGLVTTLMWYELRPVSVVLGWTVFALVVFELGWLRDSASLRLQGYVALLASFVRVFFVNLNAESLPGELSTRLYTVLPVAAAMYYAAWRTAHSPEAEEPLERQLYISRWHNYLGVILLAALVRFEVNPDWVAAGWSAMVLVLLAIAWRFDRAVFLHQGLLLSAAALFRTCFYNFELPKYYPPGFWQWPTLTVGAAAGLLLLGLPFAFLIREKERAKPAPSRFLLVRRPEQALFFVPVGIITALLAIEMRAGLITLSWGMEGVVVFLLALVIGERSFRLTGLGLLLLCVGKLMVVDVWTLGSSDRYLTFIVLGAVLLLVSFLYTRYQEKLLRYL